MISTENLAQMSIEELAKVIKIHHQEMALLYQAMARKMSKKTIGKAFLKDEKLILAEYWFEIAKEYPKILSVNFDINRFKEIIFFFKTMIEIDIQNENSIIFLKTAHNNASKDCFWYISYIRRRVKELQKDPIFKLILQKEPISRKPYSKRFSKTK